MKTLLFFAPIDADIEVNYTPDDHIPEDKIEEYGLTYDNKYQFLDDVWDVDSECYCVWRPTLQEACDVAMERFKQNVQARYEDGLECDCESQFMTWEDGLEWDCEIQLPESWEVGLECDCEIQSMTWEEFWTPFADNAKKLIDSVLNVAG